MTDYIIIFRVALVCAALLLISGIVLDAMAWHKNNARFAERQKRIDRKTAMVRKINASNNNSVSGWVQIDGVIIPLQDGE